LLGDKDVIAQLCISYRQNFIVSGYLDSTIRIWYVKKMTQKAEIKDSSKVVCVCLSRNKNYIISGCANYIIKLWYIEKKDPQ
jgi:WD40 repeat protein